MPFSVSMTAKEPDLHLLHLSTQSGWRGGEQQLAYLIEELALRSIKQLVVCPAGSKMESHCRQRGVPFVSFSAAGSFSIRLPRFLRTTAYQKGITLVHAHDSHALNHALMAHLFGLKLPIVINRRVDFPIKSRFKYKHPAVKKIICDSDTICRVMGTCLGCEEKLVTIHSGIDVDRYSCHHRQGTLRKELGIASDVFLIGNTSALVDHKDYPSFIETAELLLKKNDKFHFVIVGEGILRGEIESQIARKKLNKNISIIGFRANIPEILPDLDLFLMTSKTEGLGTAIIEAMAAQVPVVATSAGGIPELVEDNKTGLLAAVGDHQALANAVLGVWQDEGLRKRLVSGAAKIPPQFDKREIAERTLVVYRAVLADY